jgi:UDP-2-acetamido-2,6-beta-L-arabino-hexul-4-ose reductase
MAQCKKIKVKTNTDERGWFVEMIKRNNIPKDIKQVSVASIEPGCVRGNHYHLNKMEWFTIIGGSAKFCVVDIKTNKKSCFNFSEKDHGVLTVLPGMAHAIKNIGKKIVYFIEVDSSIYDHKNPDAIPYQVF